MVTRAPAFKGPGRRFVFRLGQIPVSLLFSPRPPLFTLGELLKHILAHLLELLRLVLNQRILLVLSLAVHPYQVEVFIQIV